MGAKRYIWDEESLDEDYSSLTFYHGTSNIFSISEILPAIETGNLRESWRKKLTNKAFFTDSLYSAIRYARKACEKYGGQPIVYKVKPRGVIWHIRTNEYVADSAEIICVVEF